LDCGGGPGSVGGSGNFGTRRAVFIGAAMLIGLAHQRSEARHIRTKQKTGVLPTYGNTAKACAVFPRKRTAGSVTLLFGPK